jgi:hypothetical protein
MRTMKSKWIGILIAGIGVASAIGYARAEDANPAALAAALKTTTVTLQDGLNSGSRDGTPISGKFEIEDGKLQLSVYTMKADRFDEVVIDPKSGAAAKTEKITEGGDLKDATAQQAAMTKAKITLLAATEAALKANAGARAVSVVPKFTDGHPVAELSLLQGTSFKTVTEKLD